MYDISRPSGGRAGTLTGWCVLFLLSPSVSGVQWPILGVAGWFESWLLVGKRYRKLVDWLAGWAGLGLELACARGIVSVHTTRCLQICIIAPVELWLVSGRILCDARRLGGRIACWIRSRHQIMKLGGPK
jgi:hypothetical protein